MVEKDKADDDAEEDVLAAGGGSSGAKLKPRLTMIEQQVRCRSVFCMCAAESLACPNDFAFAELASGEAEEGQGSQ